MDGMLDYNNAYHDPVNLYMFTGNSFVKRNGALVMGRGAARQVRDSYPGVDREFGRHIIHLGDYGIIVLSERNLGVFQVKRNFSAKAELGLIQNSIATLTTYAETFQRAIYMNYPGIGNGGLMQTDVAPLLQNLPNNVFLYKA